MKKLLFALLVLPTITFCQVTKAKQTGENFSTINGVNITSGTPISVSGASTSTVLFLTSAFSSTSVTHASVTGWSFAVTTGKTYRIEIIGDMQTAATTTGGSLGFYCSSSAVGTIKGFGEIDVVSTVAATGLKQPYTVCTTIGAAGSTLTSSGVTAINSPHSIYALVTFKCTTSGTFNVSWATEIASSASQINANSILIYQTLN